LRDPNSVAGPGSIRSNLAVEKMRPVVSQIALPLREQQNVSR